MYKYILLNSFVLYTVTCVLRKFIFTCNLVKAILSRASSCKSVDSRDKLYELFDVLDLPVESEDGLLAETLAREFSILLINF